VRNRRFTVRLLDVFIEKIAGVRPASGGVGIEVVIHFKRPRKTDSDADKAITWWLDGDLNLEIADKLGSGQGYVSRLLGIGAERRGTTLDALRADRKTRLPDPARAPGYQRLADEVKALWWDQLFPTPLIADHIDCSKIMVERVRRFGLRADSLRYRQSKSGSESGKPRSLPFTTKMSTKFKRSHDSFTVSVAW
jgi:hypothetical protein